MAGIHIPIESLQAEHLPCRFGRFELQGILGSGGMGRVFEAQMVGPAGFRKRVALKVLHVTTGEQGDKGRKDLINEARLGALLQHPNVIDTYDLGEIDGRLFVAMELVDGPSLRDVVKGQCDIPANAVLEMGVKICAGLGHAHNLIVAGRTADFVHRDVKPGNVLMGQYGEIKITDFGISKAKEIAERHTQTGTLRGSPAYMSPEQLTGMELDRRSDIFSMGVMLFETLTRTRVFKAKNLAQLSTQILDVDYLVDKAGVLAPAASRLPGFEKVLARCLRCRPEERYQTCEEVAEDLRTLAKGISLNRYVAGLVRAHLDGEYEGITEEVPREVMVAVESETARSPGLPDATTKTTVTSAPAETDTFVGRASELSMLGEQLTGTQHLVTLRGMAGVGKTRLALHYASAHVSGDPELPGLTYLCCASFASQVEFVDGLFLALEQPCPEALSLDQQLATLGRMLASLGDHLLVVDRFDQLVEIAESCLPVLLEGAPELRILATSRERLWLDAEYVLDLEPLPAKDGVRLLQERIGSDVLEETASSLLVRVVQLLDGNPLAIELAAAQVVEQGLNEVEHQLAEWVDRSQVETDTGLDGGSILDDALAWSWSRLEPWERDALAQCSVFQGGFFLDAAAAVVDLSAHTRAPWLMDVVVSLNNKSLLRQDEVDGSVRFGLYESIRVFAAGKLQEDESARAGLQMNTAAGRHARHYGSLGVDAVMERLEFVGGQTAVRRLRTDVRNLHTALVNALEFEAADDAAGAFVCLVGALGEGGISPDSLDQTVARLLALDNMTPGWRARSLGAASLLWRNSERSVDALEALREAVEIASSVGDRELEAKMLRRLGASHWLRHETDDAERCFKKSLRISIEEGYEEGQCLVLGNISTLAKSRGQLEKGEEYLLEELRLVEKLGLEREKYRAENNLGLLYLNQGRLEPAERYLVSSLGGADKWGDPKSQAITLLNLGLLNFRRENDSATREYYDAALEKFVAQGNVWGEGICWSNVGILMVKEEKFSEAEEVLRRGIACHEMVSNEQGIAHMQAILAHTLLEQGRLDEGWAVVLAAEAIYERLDSQRYYASLLCVRARFCLAQEDIAEARAAYVRARALAVEMQLDHEFALGKKLREIKELLDAAGPAKR